MFSMNNSSLQLVFIDVTQPLQFEETIKIEENFDLQEFADNEVKVNDFHNQDDLLSLIISRLWVDRKAQPIIHVLTHPIENDIMKTFEANPKYAAALEPVETSYFEPIAKYEYKRYLNAVSLGICALGPHLALS
jgi:hypothetical protein